MKILSKNDRIIEFQQSPINPMVEIEFDYYEYDPVGMSESFFSRWNKILDERRTD